MHPCIRCKTWHLSLVRRTQAVQHSFAGPESTYFLRNFICNFSPLQSTSLYSKTLHKVTMDSKHSNYQQSTRKYSGDSTHYHYSKKPKFIEVTCNGNSSVRQELGNSSYPECLRNSRCWLNTPFGQNYRQKTDDFAFSVMSYNVLAQSLLRSNSYLYSHCHPDALNWHKRSQTLFTEISYFRPDILCLQEVEEAHFGSFFEPKLGSLGYAAMYKRRTGDKYDGCAIFFKKNVFELVKKEEIEFRKTHVSLMDRDNVALVALFQTKNETKNRHICIATTHLLFNPNRDDIRLVQLSNLLATIDKVAFRDDDEASSDKYFPVIMCGDFNTEPYSPLYNFTCEAKWHNNRQMLPYAPQNVKKNSRFTNVQSIPLSAIGISGSCQFTNLVKSRLKNLTISAKCDEQSSTSSTEAKSNSAEQTETKCGGDEDIQVKQLSHPFNLMSVYNHCMKVQSRHSSQTLLEVTTHHVLACTTVDYIFYTVKRKRCRRIHGVYKNVDILESSLKLLSRLSLFTPDEVRLVEGLPNRMQGSDHLSLMAQFVLQVV